MDKFISISSLLGGILLAITLIWVGIYNFRLSQTKKGLLFLLSGVSLATILIYNLLFDK